MSEKRYLEKNGAVYMFQKVCSDCGTFQCVADNCFTLADILAPLRAELRKWANGLKDDIEVETDEEERQNTIDFRAGMVRAMRCLEKFCKGELENGNS